MPPIWYDGGSFKLCVSTREEHQLPHVAVMAGSQRLATVDVVSGEILAGTLNAALHRRIRKLLAEHTEEAVATFEAGLRHEPVGRFVHQPQKGDEA